MLRRFLSHFPQTLFLSLLCFFSQCSTIQIKPEILVSDSASNSSSILESLLSSSSDNSSSDPLNRQNFYHGQYYQPQQFQIHFQFRPTLGGPWANGNGNGRPVWQHAIPAFTTTSQKPMMPTLASPVVGVGSATPVQFPGAVTSNSNPASPSGFGQGSSEEIEASNRDKHSLFSSFKNTKDCACGIAPQTASKSFLERITGGMLSKEKAWPWMAAIVYIGGESPFWFCGASLINDRYLITAAHCQKTIRRRGIRNIRILLGTNGIPRSSNAKDFLEISELKTHPLYKQSIEEYDIGLIKLKRKVKMTDAIGPICLTQDGSPFVSRMATVAGWGSMKYGDDPPSNLREVEVKVVTNRNCQIEYALNYGTRITSAMLCAWLPGKDSCQGDSGGPLFLKDSNTQAYTQIGVVSFGPPQCGQTRIPGVYTRVASTVRWIQSNTKDATYCDGSFD